MLERNPILQGIGFIVEIAIPPLALVLFFVSLLAFVKVFFEVGTLIMRIRVAIALVLYLGLCVGLLKFYVDFIYK
jgi:hypothetical protein